MSRGQPQTLNFWGWIVAPALLALLATVLFATPIRVFGFGLPEPVWPMVLAFAWPVIRPSMATPLVLLGLGLFLDLFWGAALGQWALCLLIPYALALASRRLTMGQSGVVLAGWYLGLTAVMFGCLQLFTDWDLNAGPAAAAVGLQALATALLYPLAHQLIDRFEDAGARIR
jgi:rod shape-determining protein MreD